MRLSIRVLGAIFAPLLACAGAAGVRGSQPLATGDRSVAPAAAPAQAPDAPARMVIRSDAQFEEVWSKTSVRSPERRRPAVDFEKQMVLFASPGSRPGGAYRARIVDMKIDGGLLRATVLETRPKPGCRVPSAAEFRGVLVVAPRFDGPVEFTNRVTFVECRRASARPARPRPAG